MEGQNSFGGEGIASESRDSHALPKDSLIGSAAPSPPEAQIGEPAYLVRSRIRTFAVPCDDAAIERAATEILRLTRERGHGPDRWSASEIAEIVFRAAGETP